MMIATESTARWKNPATESDSEYRPTPRGSIRQAAVRWLVILRQHGCVPAVLVFFGYYFGSKLGFALTFRPHPVSVLWPPNSILLAALLLAPVRTWWLLLLAAFPAHWLSQLQSQTPPIMMLCYFISNCCEALIGAGCFRYFHREAIRLDNMRGVALFCLSG